jgi:hypothetical protein
MRRQNSTAILILGAVALLIGTVAVLAATTLTVLWTAGGLDRGWTSGSPICWSLVDP